MNSEVQNRPHDRGNLIDWLAEYLELTDEQKEALAAAYTEFRDGIMALIEQVKSGELTFDEAREQAQELREAFEAELQLILTEEQWDKLQELREKKHHHRKEHRSWQERWQDWLEEIGCDDDQIEAVLAAVETFRTGVHDVFMQLRNDEINCEEARAAIRELRDEFDAALQDILTPEQYEALLALRPDCDGKHRRP